jgi:hypothetical protein
MKGNDEGSGSAAGAVQRVHGRWPARQRRAVVVVAVVVAVASALSACGGGSPHGQGVAVLPSTTQPEASGGGPSSSQGAAAAGSTTPSSTARTGAVTTLPSASSVQEEALEFAECMRSNGITDFPDPSSGGGFLFPASSGTIQSPQFQAAQKACQKYMPQVGSGSPPTKQALARMLKVAQCMRRHGVSDFPDPVTSVPPHALAGGAVGIISDIDGVILVFPSTIDEQSPQFTQAAAECAFPLHNH